MRSLPLCLVLMLTACELAGTAPPEQPTQKVQQALVLPALSSGHYRAILVGRLMPNDWVDARLPSFLERGPSNFASEDKHPVFFLHQHYVDISFAGGPANPGWDELSTPYIVDLQLKDGKVDCVPGQGKNYPFSFIPVSHINGPPLVIFIGNQLFGLNQHSATITFNGTDFDAISNDPVEPIVYDADFENFEPVDYKGLRNLQPIFDSLSAPVWGKRAADGRAIYHLTDWKFTDPSTVLQSIEDMDISVTSPIWSAFDHPFHFEERGINNHKLGAWQVEAPFESSGAYECPDI